MNEPWMMDLWKLHSGWVKQMYRLQEEITTHTRWSCSLLMPWGWAWGGGKVRWHWAWGVLGHLATTATTTTTADVLGTQRTEESALWETSSQGRRGFQSGNCKQIDTDNTAPKSRSTCVTSLSNAPVLSSTTANRASSDVREAGRWAYIIVHHGS